MLCGRCEGIQHKLTAYQANMVGVLKAQIKSERVEPGLVGVMELANSVALKVCCVAQPYNICNLGCI